MANCHDLFEDFDDRIKLSMTKRRSLACSRNALRGKIKDDFRERRDIKTPSFHGQGSYMMHTIIAPADEDYDVDDGVYFLVDEEPSQTISTLHRWVCEAVEDHTDQEPIDKDTCVRVLFKAGYHVDLPIYYLLQDVRWRPSVGAQARWLGRKRSEGVYGLVQRPSRRGRSVETDCPVLEGVERLHCRSDAEWTGALDPGCMQRPTSRTR